MRPLALIVLLVPGLALAGEYATPCRNYATGHAPHARSHARPFVAKDVFLFLAPAPVITHAVAVKSPENLPAGFSGDSPPPKAAGYATASAPTDLAKVTAALQTCVACHSAPRGKGGVALFDAEGRFTPGPAPAVVYDAVASGAMPPRGPRPTDADLAVLKAWAGK